TRAAGGIFGGRMTSTWHPISENHAIELMAATVVFPSPLPPLALRRMVEASRGIAQELGLTNQQVSQVLGINLSAGGVPTLAPGPVPSGTTFSAPRKNEQVLAAGTSYEQIQFEAGGFPYRTSSYVFWRWHFSRLTAVLDPA